MDARRLHYLYTAALAWALAILLGLLLAAVAYSASVKLAWDSDVLQFTVSGEQHTIIVPGRPSAIRIEFE